jgi:hypothetical protein
MSFWFRVDPKRPRHPKWSCLTAEEYRFADTVLCWGCEHETEFIPAGTFEYLAGSSRRARLFAIALCEQAASAARKEHGILERIDGGFRIHDAEQYWPPGAQQPPVQPPPAAPPAAPTNAKREAGRLGGLRSAEARAAKYGSSQPKQVEANPEAPPKQVPEAATTNLSSGSGKTEDGNDQESGVAAETYRFSAREHGARPQLRKELLPEAVSATEFGPPNEYREYARELGLTDVQFDDVVLDWQSKQGAPKSKMPEVHGSLLCRFIEHRCEKNRARTVGAAAAPVKTRNDAVEANARLREQLAPKRAVVPPPDLPRRRPAEGEG